MATNIATETKSNLSDKDGITLKIMCIIANATSKHNDL